ncbi:hypothetical protein XENOCAPTIV_026800 [Xenoophorus captivus]|uniref:Uncharacterized protein n=1 Tax=Xenoophorus captivus TaxID=1517983 RepID=A0ABV0Q434_9TELE
MFSTHNVGTGKGMLVCKLNSYKRSLRTLKTAENRTNPGSQPEGKYDFVYKFQEGDNLQQFGQALQDITHQNHRRVKMTHAWRETLVERNLALKMTLKLVILRGLGPVQ